MDIEYRRDMNHNYMIVKGFGPDTPDDYETRVISTNRIPGLLTCRMQYIDQETWYSYDVTSLQRLTVFTESRKIGKKELIRILSEILRILEGLEDYLLDFQHLILLPSCIHMDFESMEIRLMYVPFYRKDIRRSLRELTEFLLGCVDHGDQEAIVLGYRFCHEVQENNTQLGDLMGVLYKGQPGVPSGTTESSIPSSCAGDAGDIFAGETDREYKEAGTGGAIWEDLSGGDGYAESEEVRPDRARSAAFRGKTAGAVPGKPAVLVVVIGLAVLAVVYLLLHTGVWQYISIYTAGGVGAAICAAALAVYIVKNKKHEKAGRQSVGSRDEAAYERYVPEPSDLSESEESQGRLLTEKKEIRISDDARNSLEVSAEGGHEMTTILSSYRPESGPEDRWLLPKLEEYAPIHLTGEDLLIGKQQQFVDMVIDSPTVSRIHARLRFRAGRYFLEDLSSRNGTCVNDEPLCGEEERVLAEGDVLVFADVAYIFSRTRDRAHCENACGSV